MGITAAMGPGCGLYFILINYADLYNAKFKIFYFLFFFLEGDSLGNAQYKVLIHSRESNEPRFKHF